MATKMEQEIRALIRGQIEKLNRKDLFREPLVGFSSAADPRYDKLKELIGDWHLHPADLLPNADGIISYFIPFTKAVVEEPKTVQHGSPKWGESYVVINDYFNQINKVVLEFIEQQGYQAAVIPATHTYDPKVLQSTWSHRSAAVIAGVGAFGANRLLITEKGSGGRFCTVITSAPLKGKDGPDEVRCLYVKNGTCGLCIKICPVNALGLDGTFHKFDCQEELFKNEQLMKESINISGADTCGKCISICPAAYLE